MTPNDLEQCRAALDAAKFKLDLFPSLRVCPDVADFVLRYAPALLEHVGRLQAENRELRRLVVAREAV